MQLYEIILPVQDNDGHSYHASHLSAMAWFRECFGGFTAVKSVGSWIDSTGRVYRDKSVSYRILTDEAPSLDPLWAWFPDQKAIYLARIGEGDCIPHP